MTKNVKGFNIVSSRFRGASTKVVKCRPVIRKMLKNAKNVKTKMQNISRKVLNYQFLQLYHFSLVLMTKNVKSLTFFVGFP